MDDVNKFCDAAPPLNPNSRRLAEPHVRLIKLIVVFCLIGSAACDKKSPAAPSSLAVSTTALVISGPDTLLTGVPASYSVTATLSDGITATVIPVWTTDDPAIASVDSSGRLEGRSHGSTSVIAAFEGRSTSKTVHVVTNYEGTWSGSYVIRACTDSGDLTDHDGGWCKSGPGRVGNVVNGVSMTLVQGGTNLSEITGTYSYFEEPITGVVTADGRLRLAGTFTDRDWWDEPARIVAAWQIRAWDSKVGGPDAMIGHFSEHLDSLYPRHGEANLEIEINSMMRTAKRASAVRQE
jgi:hypothetical protein